MLINYFYFDVRSASSPPEELVDLEVVKTRRTRSEIEKASEDKKSADKIKKIITKNLSILYIDQERVFALVIMHPLYLCKRFVTQIKIYIYIYFKINYANTWTPLRLNYSNDNNDKKIYIKKIP